MKILPTPLAPLGQYPQWINWRAIPQEDGSTKKLPLSPRTHTVCNAHDPANHCTFEEAAATGLPVGFVFIAADPFFFIDIDHCIDDAGVWNQEAMTLVASFPGCAVEISQSGHGLHIIGTQPEAVPASCGGVKFFTDKRYVALTGTNATGDAGHAPEGYRQAVETYFPLSEESACVEWTAGPAIGWTGPTDDAELILKACTTGNPLKACRFIDLWTGNADVLSVAYPSKTDDFNRSDADAALCSHLAFWTGKDCERIERIFEMSALMRDKWETRPEYRRQTIINSVSICNAIYDRPTYVHDTPMAPRPANTFIPFEALSEYFKGCTYVKDLHMIHMPDETLVSPDQFKTQMSLGNVFTVDTLGKATTKNAWRAFQERSYEAVDGTQYRPDKTDKSWTDRGRTYINTFRLWDESWFRAGDVTLFLKHLENILPVANDREILMGYLAACIQYPGKKFKWCPVIQGMEGNGKSFVAHALSVAMGGGEYVHTANASDLGNKFNGWLGSKLLAVVNDLMPIHDVGTVGVLKRLITEETQEIQKKGKDQISSRVFANFIITSNYQDVVQKTATDRRFCALFTAQQKPGDLERSGLTEDYFVRLWDWFNNEGGAGAIAYYLKHYRIPPRQDPSRLSTTAPRTTSTDAAIEAARSPLEQLIRNAIEEEQPGFRGGWVSSIALRNLCKDRHAKQRAAILAVMGYVKHPALPQGAATSIVMREGGRPKLYVLSGSPLARLTTEVTKKFTDDNYS